MGIEGAASGYRKLEHVDTRELVAELQSHGIRVLGSTIVGLENHTPANIDAAVDYAVAHATDFHQFMLYTPNPGTPLYEEHRRKGTLLDEADFSPADAHGQYRFNYRHAHIPPGDEEGYLLEAFRRDFAVNGPSLARLIRTLLTGWQRYRHCPDPRIRDRYRREVAPLRTTYAGAVWAMRRHYRHDAVHRGRMHRLLTDICREFGPVTRLLAPVIGRWAYRQLKREERRLAAGWRYEPPCFREPNAAMQALESTRPASARKSAPKPVRLTVPAATARS